MDAAGLPNTAPAIRALGSLFKLTEVFIWDGAYAGTQKGSSSRPLRTRLSHDDNDDGGDSDIFSNTASAASEDMELAREMDALGLPLSFHSCKEKRDGISKGKRKGAKKKHSYNYHGIVDGDYDFSRVSEGGIASPTVFHDNISSSLCCMPMMGKNDSSYRDVTMDASESGCLSGEEEVLINLNGAADKELSFVRSKNYQGCEPLQSNFVSSDDVKTGASYILAAETSMTSSLTNATTEHAKEDIVGKLIECECLEGSSVAYRGSEGEKIINAGDSEWPCIADLVADLHSTEMLYCNETGSYKCSDEFGVWSAYWDSFYQRNYFYNIHTQESTWDPPPGMEHFAFGDIGNKSSEMNALVTGMEINCHDINSHDLEDKKTDLLESVNDYRSSCQLLNGLSAGNQVVTDKLMSVMVTTNPSSKFEHSGEIQELNKSSDDANASCSLSDTRKHIGRWGDEVKDQDCGSDLQMSSSCTACELGSFEYIGENEGLISCQENYKEENYKVDDDDLALELSDASSFINMITKAASEDELNSNVYLNTVFETDKLDPQPNPLTVEHKKKVRRMRQQRKLFGDNRGLQFHMTLKECNTNISKYWHQRYLLFSKFDDGIKMDEEGWFSVTPESLARHHAIRCGGGVIIDCFTGVGGNAIQFAQMSRHVIAIDIDSKRIEYAQHNAAIYGADDSIDFINGDFFLLAPNLEADTVFLSPPWGGPDYLKLDTYDIKMLKPRDGHFLFNAAKEIASRIVMFLPRNVNLNQLAELSLSTIPPWSLEVERNFINGKLKAITAYFSVTSM